MTAIQWFRGQCTKEFPFRVYVYEAADGSLNILANGFRWLVEQKRTRVGLRRVLGFIRNRFLGSRNSGPTGACEGDHKV